MILFPEKQYVGNLKAQIDNLLGEPIPFRKQLKTGAVGSRLYRLKNLSIKDKRVDFTELNLRCNFEKFPNGFLLRINNDRDIYFIVMTDSSINNIEFSKGEEYISPYFFSLMKLLLTLGVHIRYARFFQHSEYSIDPFQLKITSGDEFIELDSNGWNYSGEIKYFDRLIKRKIC